MPKVGDRIPDATLKAMNDDGPTSLISPEWH